MPVLRLGEPQPVWMTWTVNEAGQVTIQESGWEASWSGQVDGDLHISLQRTYTLYVGEEPVTRVSTYVGTIRSDAGTYVLEIEGIEEWFPPDPDYVFRRVYSLKKGQ